MERKNAWEKYPEGKKREEVFQFAEDYRKFISECKTERECTTEFAKRAEKAGFVNLDEVLEKGTKFEEINLDEKTIHLAGKALNKMLELSE